MARIPAWFGVAVSAALVLVSCVGMGAPHANNKHRPRRPAAPSLATACGKLEVPTGTLIRGTHPNGLLSVHFPNGSERRLPPCRKRHQQQRPTEGGSSGSSQGAANQWLAWYYTETAVWMNGATSFTSQWFVPAVPAAQSNLCFFNGLQPTYDPRSYDFILQPVLSTGFWMDGDFPNQWILNSVMCHNGGWCTYATPFKTSPGNLITGTIVLTSGTPPPAEGAADGKGNERKTALGDGSSNSNSASSSGTNIFKVVSHDNTTGLSNHIYYETNSQCDWAFVTMEHNPAGPVNDCNSLPRPTFTFYNNTLVPGSSSMWQGVIGDNTGCNIDTSTFPSNAAAEMTISM